jgi:hypothetical protein
MKKIFTLILIFFVCFFNAQILPYLNASTANNNEFPVDADTNIYMFHGNRLVKTDKNFNTIWANTYSGLNFSNLLLSKTGSIYFIAKNGSASIYFGKLNPNGSVSWVKTTQTINAILSTTTSTSYTLNLASLLLDRNNNLLLSGDNFLLKTDTLGNGIKLKVFNGNMGTTPMQGLSIISDSAGIYKLAGAGTMALSGGSGVSIYSFSDITNAFTSVKNHLTGSYQSFSWGFTRSRFANNFYARLQGYSIPASIPINQLAKFDISGNAKWFKAISNAYMNPAQIAFYVNENNNGDLFYATGTYNSNVLYTSAFLKLDSNGVGNNFQTAMLYNYNIGPSFYAVPSHAPHSIYDGIYYFDVSGYSFPNNPLTIQKFSSALTFSCSHTITDNSGNAGPTFTQSMVSPTIQPITSFTLSNFSTSATSVTFSVNLNFCLVTGANDQSLMANDVFITPNPAQDKLKIKLSNDLTTDEIEIIDVNCRVIGKYYSTSEIYVNELTPGIYFLNIKAGHTTLRKKFLKE